MHATILQTANLDFDNVIADTESIRKHNPQRGEMEQLTGVVFEDVERQICVGYKDITPDEFWVHGHFPGRPLMPGLLMCEAAAQLCSVYAHRNNLSLGRALGLGGLETVRFRSPVSPPGRLVIAIQVLRARPGVLVVNRFQCFVEATRVCDGIIKGVAL